jgi:hypothetical protein
MVNLEADEYTATIMLLGYLSQQDFAKVDLIQQQIRAHPEWRSNSLFLDRDENRQKLIDFVRHQSSREIAQRSLMQAEEGDEDRRRGSGYDSGSLGSDPKPLSGDLEGELDDDIEIDVTTLSAKLRGLMNSSSSSMPTS